MCFAIHTKIINFHLSRVKKGKHGIALSRVNPVCARCLQIWC